MVTQVGQSMLAIVLAAVALAPEGTDGYGAIYEKVRPSIVGVRAIAPLGERSGTGIVIDAKGLILTSNAIVPAGAKEIRVWLPGAKRVTAEVVGSNVSLEITLLKIDVKELTLSPLAIAESHPVRIGDAVFTIGNAFFSIINDDQPSFCAGIVSGMQKIEEERSGASYRGPVFETTAAVNPGMEGGPLLNAEGKMIGFITPNYSPRRWLGLAIPSGAIASEIARIAREEAGNARTDPGDAAEGFHGITVADREGKVVAAAVARGSPAWERGIREGDIVLALTDTPVASAEEFRRIVAKFKAGEIVWIKIDVGGEGDVETIKLTLVKAKAEKKP